MLDLDKIDVDLIATALADQTDYEHRWLIDPRTGEVVFWTSDTGIDGESPVDLDEVDLDPDPRSLNGKGAFRRLRNELYDRHPELISVWHSLREARASARAVRWLAEQGLLEEDAARQFTNDHPEPALP